MYRTPKARNQRTRRVLEQRAPKTVENVKTTLFLRSTKTGAKASALLHDLRALRRPHIVKFGKSNPIHPFEDATSLEFYSQKCDASHIMLESHSKKRPNNIVFSRMYNHHVLDMVEFGVDDIQPMEVFKEVPPMLGAKPMLLFHGDLFDTNKTMQALKLVFLDMFRGEVVEAVNVEGLQHVVSLTAVDSSHVALRTYRVTMLKSGTTLPRIELSDLGPHADLSLRRVREASKDVLKDALKVPRVLKPRKVKNISYDPLGNKQARVHLGRQSLAGLQTRKMKGLKRAGKAPPSKSEGNGGSATKKRKVNTGNPGQ